MENKSNKTSRQKNYLIIALASLIACSAMAASVMSGCGENTEQSSNSNVHETQIVTKIVNNEITETYYVDENGNRIEPNESGDGKGDSSSSSNGGNSGNSSSSGNANNSGGSGSSAAVNKPASSNSGSSSAQKPQSSGSASSKPVTPNSNSGPAGSNAGGNTNSGVCTVDGSKFNVGDKITCTYNLKTPVVLENYQASIKYDSKCLKATSAKMLGEAKSGSVLNYKAIGKVNFNGTNISTGYDYTNGGDFVTVTYEVIGGGSTNPKMEWVAACKFGDSNNNYISKDGTPKSGFKLSSVYKKAE